MKIEKLYSLFQNATGIATDSRQIKKGQIFFALKGENFNGNKYATQALREGASYAIVDEKVSDNEDIILVDNVLKCMQRLATYHREILGIPVIAITGTNGKTTTKELVSNVLAKKYKVTYTQGNFNNHIGVPITLLSLTKETEIAVVEMGANHQGEIGTLCQIAKPNFGIITNIGKAHLEGFGSFENVVKTKSELYNYLKQSGNGYVFYNEDDDLLRQLSIGLKSESYGMNGAADARLVLIGANPFLRVSWKNYEINTQLVGNYNFDNVAAAVCIGQHFKVDDGLIVSALSEYKPQNNRSQLQTTANNNTVIIDAYNANPESMRLSIENFSKFQSSEKILIIGDMLELGDACNLEHEKILNQIQQLNFKKVFVIGKHFNVFINKFKHFNFMKNTDEMCNYLVNNPLNNKTVLLKASRGIKLEKTLQYL